MDKVDETIQVICDWIQARLEEPSSLQKNEMIPEMIKGLAELLSARRICSIPESDLQKKIVTSLKKQIVEEMQKVNHEFRY